jgi:hypothetical protein
MDDAKQDRINLATLDLAECETILYRLQVTPSHHPTAVSIWITAFAFNLHWQRCTPQDLHFGLQSIPNSA